MSLTIYLSYIPIVISSCTMVRTGPPAQDQLNFAWTSKFQFLLELNKNKFKNLIGTSKLKFSFRGLILAKQGA